MSMPSIDDSDVEEALSPAGEKDVVLDNNTTISPWRTRSASYADQIDGSPSSPIPQHLGRSHSTTMDKLKKKPRTYGSRTTLEGLGLNRSVFDGTWARNVANEDSENAKDNNNIDDDGGISFLSRDGDVTTYSNISISTPDFMRVEEMPPPRSTRPPQSSHVPVPTQAMSDWSENPLEMLARPRVDDDLPSTKPSTGLRESYSGKSTGGTQDELNMAAQIGDELLAGEVAKADAHESFYVGDPAADESQDELALGDSATSMARQSRKRTRENLGEEQLQSRRSSKRQAQEPAEEDELFAGLPTEQYQPRKSRLRSSAVDDDLFANIDFSKRPEAKKKDKKEKISRRKTTGDAVVVESHEEDMLDAVEQADHVSTKTRSRRTKTTTEEVTMDPATMVETPETPLHAIDTKDAIVVESAAVVEYNQDTTLEQDEIVEEIGQKPKKRTNSKRGKQKAIETCSSQVTDGTSLATGDLSSQKITPNGKNTRSRRTKSLDSHLVELESKQEAEEAVIPKQSKKSRATRTKSAQYVESHDESGAEPGQAIENTTVTMPKTVKGKGKKAAAKKSNVEVVNLSSQAESIVSKVDVAADTEPGQGEEPESLNLSASRSTEVIKPIPLHDSTNTALATKAITPVKPEQPPIKHSPIKNNSRPSYRVGLSRRTRIEPLLKIVRKEKDTAPKAASGKK